MRSRNACLVTCAECSSFHLPQSSLCSARLHETRSGSSFSIRILVSSRHRSRSRDGCDGSCSWLIRPLAVLLDIRSDRRNANSPILPDGLPTSCGRENTRGKRATSPSRSGLRDWSERRVVQDSAVRRTYGDLQLFFSRFRCPHVALKRTHVSLIAACHTGGRGFESQAFRPSRQQPTAFRPAPILVRSRRRSRSASAPIPWKGNPLGPGVSTPAYLNCTEARRVEARNRSRGYLAPRCSSYAGRGDGRARRVHLDDYVLGYCVPAFRGGRDAPALSRRCPR